MKKSNEKTSDALEVMHKRYIKGNESNAGYSFRRDSGSRCLCFDIRAPSEYRHFPSQPLSINEVEYEGINLWQLYRKKE